MVRWLAFYSPYDNGFLHFNIIGNNDPLENNIVSSFAEENDGKVWIGTENGILNLFDCDKKTFKVFKFQTPKNSISNIKCMALDKKDKLWIGTSKGVDYFDYVSQKSTHLDGIPGDNVYGILKSDNGDLWFSTVNGLFCYNLRKKIFSSYTKKDGLPITLFNPGAALKCNDGSLLFGGPNGFNLCYPK